MRVPLMDSRIATIAWGRTIFLCKLLMCMANLRVTGVLEIPGLRSDRRKKSICLVFSTKGHVGEVVSLVTACFCTDAMMLGLINILVPLAPLPEEPEEEISSEELQRQHPYWQRLEQAILKALLPFPEALLAMSQAVAALEPLGATSP